jgi:ferredoxin
MTETLTWKERFYVEKLDRLGRDLKHGAVTFDEHRCRGCGLCERACFTGVITGTLEKKPAMSKGAEALCVSCGACTAICPEQAVTLSEFLEFHGYFKWLDRGGPMPPRQF